MATEQPIQGHNHDFELINRYIAEYYAQADNSAAGNIY